MRAPSTLDKSIHLIGQIARDIVRDEMRNAGGISQLNGKGFIDQSGGYSNFFNTPRIPAPAGPQDIPPLVQPNDLNEPMNGGGGVESIGVHYGTWPLEQFDFGSANARFGNLDYYVGIQFITVMRGATSEGGHAHSGQDGDGALIPADNVVLADGTTLAKYLGVEGISASGQVPPDATGVNGPPPTWPAGASRAQIFDDFEGADQAIRFQILHGDPVRVQDANGNWRWRLEPDTLIRLRTPGYSFNDRVTVRIDCKWDLGNNPRGLDIRVRSRVTNQGNSWVAGFRCGDHCFVGQLDYTDGIVNILEPLEADFSLPNDAAVHSLEVLVRGTKVQLGADGNQQMVAQGAEDDSDEQGYVEIYVPPDGEAAIIDNFFLTRSTIALVEPHAPQHHANGFDPLDVSDLADSNNLLHGAMLPATHHTTHETGGADTIDVSNLTDGQGRLLSRDLVEALTMGGDASALHHHDSMAVVNHADAALPPGITVTPGVSAEGAPADHRHPFPRWKVEFYVSDAISDGLIPSDAQFVSPNEFLVTYLQTLGGEFVWTGAGDGVVFRAKIGIANTSVADYDITLTVPALIGLVLRVRIASPSLGDLLVETWSASASLNGETTFTLFHGETTVIYLYGAGSGGSVKHVGLYSKEADGDLFAASKGLSWVAVD